MTKTIIKLAILLISSLLLLVPSISTIQTVAIQLAYNSTTPIQHQISPMFNNLLQNTPTKIFILIYTIIMILLQIRMLLLTPLAITPSDEYWGSYEIKNYFFAAILFTLIYRYAFWYVLFHNIAERNNWELPYVYIQTLKTSQINI